MILSTLIVRTFISRGKHIKAYHRPYFYVKIIMTGVYF